MMVPGVIAYHLYQQETLPTIDMAYPTLVKDVLPQYMSGFFLAVLLGAVFSSFNSLLNSAATLFVLDVYQPLKKSFVSEKQLINVAKITSIILAIFSFVVAPLLMFAPEGLWQVIRVFTGFYNIPVIAVVLIGLFTHKVPALGAKVAIVFHVIAYGLLQFVLDVEINFIHIYAILFCIEVAIMLFIGYLRPVAVPHTFQRKETVDLTPWRYAIPCAILLLAGIISLYLIFSEIGFVNGVSVYLLPSLATVWLLALGLSIYSDRHWQQKYQRHVDTIGR